MFISSAVLITVMKIRKRRGNLGNEGSTSVGRDNLRRGLGAQAGRDAAAAAAAGGWEAAGVPGEGIRPRG
eukprot:COSAG01_NODE_23_length_37704_cov_30.005877_36_plen_70_part_00